MDLTRPTVVVVGAGPVGALAALELARHGVSTVVLEARTEVSWTSRAICISRRSLEILDRAGAGAAFREKGLGWSKGRTFHRDRLVFRLELPEEPSDRHPPFINLQQCFTEQFLIDAIAAAPAGPELRWGSRVTGVEQTGDGARIEVEGSNGNCMLEADWIVAADGARSVVRSSLGLSMRGTSYEGRYLISDIKVEGAEWPVERHVWFDAPANPGSTVILHVQPDGIWRIDMQLRDGESPDEALRDDNLLPRLQAQLDMIGVTAPWRLVWKSVYRAHSLSLDDYRHGRVLFAGDAAHLVPIFGVRGLNSGFDDAHNLAWKLAMVARGESPVRLLDSYSWERRRATGENIANADKSTWFMSPPTAGFRRMRDAALTLAHDHGWARSLINPRQSSFHIYDGSPIIVADGDPDVGVRPGAPIPNLPFQGSHLHLLLEPRRFCALLFEAFLDRDSVEQIVGTCEALRIQPLIIAPGRVDVAETFGAQRFPLYLVRPDEHVAARFAAEDVERLGQAFEIAIGRREHQSDSPMQPRVATPTEDIYEALSIAIDQAESAHDATALERIALTLAHAIADSSQARNLVEAALKAGSNPAAKETE